MAEVTMARANRWPHTVKLICQGGCQGPQWMWAERAWTKPHGGRGGTAPRLKWCQHCNGKDQEPVVKWRMNVPTEVVEQFGQEDQRRMLQSLQGQGPRQLAIMDQPRKRGRDLSPGPGPWGRSSAPRTPVTNSPAGQGAAPQAPPPGWERLESTTTPGLLYYRRAATGRTQFEDPRRTEQPTMPAPTLLPPTGPVVMAQHRSTMIGVGSG